MNRQQILRGDCREILPTLEVESVQCCVTSPPYWGLRDYGTAQWEGGDPACDHRSPTMREGRNEDRPMLNGSVATNSAQLLLASRSACGKCGALRIDSQLGLEATPEEYIANMVGVFREVWRVLRDDGTLWVNMGDSYNSHPGQRKAEDKPGDKQATNRGSCDLGSHNVRGLKPKDLCMIPARVALALQADGWYLRSDIIWHKPNPMPESVTDRPTKSHEYIFLLAKNGGNPLVWRARDTGEWSYNPDLSEKITLDAEDEPRWKGFDYFYDAEAIRELADRPEGAGNVRRQSIDNQRSGENANLINGLHKVGPREYRNKRTVWTIATQPYSEAHFATFPEELPKLCILVGSRVGDTVLDPFAGSGTTGQVAIELGRRAILIELNPEYIELARERTFVTPGFL